MPSVGSCVDSIWPGKDSVRLEVNRNFQKWGKKGGGGGILIEQNTQNLWYISKGVSITAVPGGTKRERRHI